MTPRRALAVAVMAVQSVATTYPDISEWSQALVVLRGMLEEVRRAEISRGQEIRAEMVEKWPYGSPAERWVNFVPGKRQKR